MSLNKRDTANGSSPSKNGQDTATMSTTSTSSSTPTFKKPPRSSLAPKKSKKKKPISWSFWIWSALGVIAAVVGSKYFSRKSWTPVQTFVHDFVCRAPGGYCHPSLLPSRRTQVAIRTIPKGEVVLEVPRNLQIWDLDALRDTFVREELLSARHAPTENPLESGAFLAAYLALRIQASDEEDPLRPYFDILPSYEELAEFHPVLWSVADLVDLEQHSSSFAVAKGYQDMVSSEYKAFISVSSKFAAQVSEKEYKTMRVHVLSRSFGTGPPGPEAAVGNTSLEDELDMYMVKAGVDLTKGCHSMVPMLDMYDHHATPNVEWQYDNSTRAFVVRAAAKGIKGGYEVMDSYGKYTDSHLFAKFGFVNGDGSDYTQASIAAMHKPQNFGMKQFSYLPMGSEVDDSLKATIRDVMLRYLTFDDGYAECIEAEKQPEAFELKRLKLEHLVRMANAPERWIVNVGPRNKHSRPARSTEYPITPRAPRFALELDLNGRNIISTCRLIALHHDDFDGKAPDILKDALQNETNIFVGPDAEELEYRALMCMARLTGLKLMQYDTDEAKETARVRELNRNAYQSRNWTISHVRLGETQTLDVVRKLGLQGAKDKGEIIKKKLKDESDEVLPTFRTMPCPMELTTALLNK